MYNGKVKINHLASGYWLAPKEKHLIGPRNRDYIFKVYPTLEELIVRAGFKNQELWFSFNRDVDFKNFNLLQKIKGIDFQINQNIFNQIYEKKLPYEWEVVPNVVILWDLKGLQTLYKGIIPFYSKRYYAELGKGANSKYTFDDKVYFKWRSFLGFKQIKKMS